ncbi:carcinoembryonic antigen-related cell adhesion molecule 21-like, partial [Scomber scombrus]
SRRLTEPESQNKHLLLDPVTIQHAGNYSCAVKTPQNIISGEKTLTIQSITGTSTAAAAGVVAALLVIMPLAVFFWIRRKRSSRHSPRPETSDNMELNPGPVCEDISAQTTEQADLHYSRVHLSKDQTDALYSTVQPHQPGEQDQVLYSVVTLRSDTTPDYNGQVVDP